MTPIVVGVDGVVAIRKLLPDDQTAEAIRLYEAGMNIADLAFLFGVSHGGMGELLARSGVTLRAKGRRGKGAPGKLTLEHYLG